MNKNYLLIFSIFFITFVSCKEISVDDDSTTSQTKKTILQALAGEYEGCSSDVVYSFLYRRSQVSIVGDSYVVKSRITADPTCATATVLTYNQTFTIDSAEFDSVNPSKINLGLKVVNFEASTDSVTQQVKNFCGITDWALFVLRDITGLSCPNLLGQDTFHTEAKDVNEMEYIQVTRTGSALSIPISFAESGDSINEIKSSDLQVTTKK
jgi:hypothetical protein